MHVHIINRTRPADPGELAQRADVVARLENLGMLDPAEGNLNTEVTEWVAVIGSAEFPIGAYAVEQTSTGAPAVSLVLYPDSLTVGEAPVQPPAQPEKTAEPVRVWGSTGRDPREGLPGWSPKLAQQVADQAQAVAQ